MCRSCNHHVGTLETNIISGMFVSYKAHIYYHVYVSDHNIYICLTFLLFKFVVLMIVIAMKLMKSLF
ncbi:unnamed protein product [Musa acuminata var. zebrina]